MGTADNAYVWRASPAGYVDINATGTQLVYWDAAGSTPAFRSMTGGEVWQWWTGDATHAAQWLKLWPLGGGGGSRSLRGVQLVDSGNDFVRIPSGDVATKLSAGPANVQAAWAKVSHVIIHHSWVDLEPTPGVLSSGRMTGMINQLTTLKALGKKALLTITAGRRTPAWGSSYFVMDDFWSVNKRDTPETSSLTLMTVATQPWTAGFQNRWRSLLVMVRDALEAANVLDSLEGLRLTAINVSTSECRWPSGRGPYIGQPTYERFWRVDHWIPRALGASDGVETADMKMKARGWRPSLALEAYEAIADIQFTVFPDQIMTGSYNDSRLFCPWVNEAGTVFTTWSTPHNVQEQIGVNLAGTYGRRVGVHSDSIREEPTGAGNLTGLDAHIFDAGLAGATIGWQVAENRYGHPWLPSGQAQPAGCHCPAVADGAPAAEDTSCACNPTEFRRVVQAGVNPTVGKGEFIEIYGPTVVAYPDQVSELADTINALPLP